MKRKFLRQELAKNHFPTRDLRRPEMGWALKSDSRDLIARLGFKDTVRLEEKYQRKVQGLTQLYAAMVHMI